jgi:hypothetical protein
MDFGRSGAILQKNRAGLLHPGLCRAGDGTGSQIAPE